MAEFLGTFVLVAFTCGSKAQAAGNNDSDLHAALCAGLGLAAAVLASDGVSGGHVNPAVTVGMAAAGRCAAARLPVYWAAQYAGAFAGAAAAYGAYGDLIGALGSDARAASFFCTFPRALPGGSSFPSALALTAEQLLAAFLLMLVISAATDSLNCNVASGLVPLVVGLGLTAIRLAFAGNSGAALNPAADMGP